MISERSRSDFASVQKDGEMSNIHKQSQEQELSSVSQAESCGSSYMGSSMNLSDIEDLSLDDSSCSNISCTTGGISYAIQHSGES